MLIMIIMMIIIIIIITTIIIIIETYLMMIMKMMKKLKIPPPISTEKVKITSLPPTSLLSTIRTPKTTAITQPTSTTTPSPSACAGALDCFRCGSFNGSDPHCDDPFHFNYSSHYLASPCLAGWKNRNGLYPATHCIKLSGYFYQTSERMVVRSCTIDSGTLTIDTELGRQSHCGMFTYDGKTVVGCLDSCNSFDACNISAALVSPGFLFVFLVLLQWVSLI
ncbi:uncharacterized protein LOC119589779 [Penaeus monodon]|uniref:uncharacterized protein LOC119589779 n=1 Tax=Penaeus monodon TaxID=6687 RepID=UPI0018A7BB0E|nr:uncharacterized protein LOC119589779 [Penaeus monodon]